MSVDRFSSAEVCTKISKRCVQRSRTGSEATAKAYGPSQLTISDPTHSLSSICARKSGSVLKNALLVNSSPLIPTQSAKLHFAEQIFVPVSATLAIIHLPSTRTRLNRSVPQWSTFPSTRKSNGAHTTARSLSIRTSGS